MDSYLPDAPPGPTDLACCASATQSELNLYECLGLWPRQSFLLASDLELNLDVFTFYNLAPLSHDPLCLGFGPFSKHFPKHKMHQFQKMSIFDLCGGIGGFTMGSSPLGIDTMAFLESNDLACQSVAEQLLCASCPWKS